MNSAVTLIYPPMQVHHVYDEITVLTSLYVTLFTENVIVLELPHFDYNRLVFLSIWN